MSNCKAVAIRKWVAVSERREGGGSIDKGVETKDCWIPSGILATHY